jgi:pimeloyl-ACP methyl ester carboxylesterase
MKTLTRSDARSTRIVRAGPHQVAVDLYGNEGPPVLLLHGIPGGKGIWAKVAARLSHCQIFAPDLLGFGESSEPKLDPHFAGQAEMLAAPVGELGCKSMHIVGFDFGGQ